jgi:hypothetical protein
VLVFVVFFCREKFAAFFSKTKKEAGRGSFEADMSDETRTPSPVVPTPGAPVKRHQAAAAAEEEPPTPDREPVRPRRLFFE